MWMMGCGGGGEGGRLCTSNPFRGRKLRPLIPRLSTTISPTATTTAAAFSSCLYLHRANCLDTLLPFHNHWTMRGMEQEGRREATRSRQPAGSRWNPTREQLRALEDVYERGTRTPTVHEIQHIAGQLRRYGKIEGKNVFYWFQNHKARERKTRRRQIEEAAAAAGTTAVSYNKAEDSHKKDSGGAAASAADCSSSGGGGVSGELEEESKSSAPPKTCSSIAAAAAGRGGEVSIQETVHHPWFLQQTHQSWPDGNATWQQLTRQQRLSPLTHHPPCHTTNADPKPSAVVFSRGGETKTTLQLFPLSSERDVAIPTDESKTSPSKSISPHLQFFQFLPLESTDQAKGLEKGWY